MNVEIGTEAAQFLFLLWGIIVSNFRYCVFAVHRFFSICIVYLSMTMFVSSFCICLSISALLLSPPPPLCMRTPAGGGGGGGPPIIAGLKPGKWTFELAPMGDSNPGGPPRATKSDFLFSLSPFVAHSHPFLFLFLYLSPPFSLFFVSFSSFLFLYFIFILLFLSFHLFIKPFQ
jgi:hypothetical protein